MGRGDDAGQLAQVAVHAVEQVGELRTRAVGGDSFQVGRVEPAQPGGDLVDQRSGRDEPDDPGGVLRSARSRSNW